MTAPYALAADIAASVRGGDASATSVTKAALARIAAINPAINAFTDVTEARALEEAASVDADLSAGRDPGPLAGVPFAVKNLFDVAGMTTRAGSKINRANPPATGDAVLIRRLRAAGAVLVGAVNMGEYAYDFTGENAHDGACRNPHDPTRMTGGSSSGSGSATAAGLAPISLGSDTNGSLRVPAALCGVFSLKPTYGRLPRSGTFPFVDSLDHLGPLARSARDLALAYDAMQGHDAGDAACAHRAPDPAMPTLTHGTEGLRIGIASGWFEDAAGPEVRAAVARAAGALGADRAILMPHAQMGRAAAYLITNAESSAFHLGRLRAQAADFDPDTRDRFLAGALLPAAWIARAQRVRRWWLERMLETFRDVDLILAPATPAPAPPIGASLLRIGARDLPLRPNLGLFAQPFSAVGLPVVTAPVFDAGALPLGVQIIAPPWREDLCLRAAMQLEEMGVAAALAPKL
ncbi:MAG: AtzE family amidohydrolase [Paracoccaceae bacterium]|jgi:AtzE family amidohydrolase